MGRSLINRVRVLAITGMAALAGTTFQNGCATSDLYALSSILDEFSSEYYSDWDYGYYEDPSSDPFGGWAFGDVKSG